MSNQKRDEQQNSKQSIPFEETRRQIDAPDNAQRLKEIKETDILKEYESTDEALKTNKCSPEHIQSLLSVVTKGLLVQSDDHFDLKAQAVNYTAPVDLQQPSLTDMQCEKEFLKVTDMHKLDDKVRSFGLDVSASANTHLFKLSASNSASGETNVETDKKETEIYLAKAKYAFVPIKSFQLRQENMRLDATAQKEVQFIGRLITESGSENQMVHQTCCDFLIRYGSHVSIGTHHVGGILKMCTVCHDTANDSHSKCLLTLRQEHALYVGTTMEISGGEGAINNSNVERSHRETKNHENRSKVENCLTRFGGPLYGENFRQWRKGLIQDSDTWTVIHRGDVTGIWNILLNCKSEIVNCTQVAGLLQRTWEQKWGKSSNIKSVDKILIDNIMSIYEEIDLTVNCTAEVVMKLLKKFAGIAAGNRKFGEYTKGGEKWNQFLEIAVSMTEELHLESRFHLKLLLRLAGQRMLNLHDSLLTWYVTPLLCCNKNVFGKIMSFIQNDFRHVYASVIELSSDPYCRYQVEDQAAMEIARIIYHHGQKFTNVAECILLAEIAIQLPFDFEDFKHEKQSTQDKSTGKTCKTVETFFLSLPQLLTERTKRIPKSAVDFVHLIENVYFPTLEISAELFSSVDQLKLQQTVYRRMAALRENMLKTSYQVNKEFVKLALLSVLWSDSIKSTEAMKLQKCKNMFHTGKMIWFQNEKMDQLQELSCCEVLTFVPGFISTIKTYKKTDLQFEQIGIDCCRELFDRFHEFLFMNDLSDLKRRNSIEFALNLCNARRGLSEMAISEINTFDTVAKILTEMEQSIPKDSTSVCLVSKIPTTEKDFVYQMINCIIPTWKAMTYRLQDHNNNQIAAAHVNAYFVEQIKVICTESCHLTTKDIENDIRIKLSTFLSKSPSNKITWGNVERELAAKTSLINRVLVRLMSIIEFLYKEATKMVSSLAIAFPNQ